MGLGAKTDTDFYFQMYFSGLRVASVGEVVLVHWQSKPSVFLASGLSHKTPASFSFACMEIVWVPLRIPETSRCALFLFHLGLGPGILW